MKQKNMTLVAKIAVLIATLLWGSSFIVMKSTVDKIPYCFLLAFRFSVSAVILAVIFFKRLKKINFEYIWQGAIIGGALFLAYYFQTIGLTGTTAGKNAFLTAVYCVAVPFMFWAVDKKAPDIYNILAAFLCITGIGFVSLTSSFSVGMGDFLTLIGGLMFAVHIVAVAHFSKGKDMSLIAFLQFFFCALYSGAFSLFTEDISSISLSANILMPLLYLSVFCTCIAMSFQNFGQKYMHPSALSIMLSLEAVFGVIFAVLIRGEQLNARLVIGFILIFSAIIISETKLSFLKKNKK